MDNLLRYAKLLDAEGDFQTSDLCHAAALSIQILAAFTDNSGYRQAAHTVKPLGIQDALKQGGPALEAYMEALGLGEMAGLDQLVKDNPLEILQDINKERDVSPGKLIGATEIRPTMVGSTLEDGKVKTTGMEPNRMFDRLQKNYQKMTATALLTRLLSGLSRGFTGKLSADQNDALNQLRKLLGYN